MELEIQSVSEAGLSGLGIGVNGKGIEEGASTKRAFWRHVSTSGGREVETVGLVAEADASQFRGGG